MDGWMEPLEVHAEMRSGRNVGMKKVKVQESNLYN
jgi:hypothetical protein